MNFTYVLAEENGEVHPPKDNTRREIARSEEHMTALRQALMSSLILFYDKGHPLGVSFLRQMGREDEATEVEAMLSNPYIPTTNAGSQKKTMKEGSQIFEIDCIVGVKQSTGKAQKYALVRWTGYHPSWERCIAPIG